MKLGLRQACVWVLVLAGCRPTASPVDVRSAAGAATASNRFGFDLYDELRGVEGNLIFSPVSAEVALAMTSAGARGPTLAEMARVLHVDALSDAHGSFGGLMRSLNERDGAEGVTIHLANRLWGQQGTRFRPEFVSLLKDSYQAPLGEVDYIHAAEGAREAINRWAAQETHDRITEVIPPGMLDARTRLVLANAVYFKGAWKFPFVESATVDEDFTTTGGARVKAPMMRQFRSLYYAHVADAQVVDLPYRGAFTMVVVLPDQVDGLPAIERRVRGDYDGWIAHMESRVVDLKLPRWKVTSHFDLGGALAHLGMERPFGKSADFSAMADGPLQIDDVVQEAFVESNEQGTEAAAVTAVEITATSAQLGPPPPPPAIFHADHPFIYFIRDPTTGAVLFVGRVNDPTR